MARPGKDEIAAALGRQRVLPLFTCADVATGMRVLEALHAGGVRLVEFTNRSAAAIDVFRGMVAEAAKRMPDIVLGAGTIIDRSQAEAFHAAGAAFLVAPHLDEDVGAYCREHGILWCPGTGTVTEMVRAHRLGADVIKVFPADALGGPAFIKAVRGPCPWLKLMPSSGVTLDEANLQGWFAAGAHCVGIGSNLIDAGVLAGGLDAATAAARCGELTDHTRTIVSLLQGA